MSFSAARWAEAFTREAAGDWEAGCGLLTAFTAAAHSFKGWISGRAQAAEVLTLIKRACASAGIQQTQGIKTAEALLFQLITRGKLNELDRVIQAVRTAVAVRENVLEVRLEVATEPDTAFLHELTTAIKHNSTVREVRFSVHIMPELIGGCRIITGSDRCDLSLRGKGCQLESYIGGRK